MSHRRIAPIVDGTSDELTERHESLIFIAYCNVSVDLPRLADSILILISKERIKEVGLEIKRT